MADMYSKKARELVDNFQVDEAMEFYNKARAELMIALERTHTMRRSDGDANSTDMELF